MTASPPGSLRISDWVILNCSFSRPDLPASVHWFRGRVPVRESPHHHLAGSFLFLPQVSPSDSGLWGCILTYRDGFNVSLTHNLTVLGNFFGLPSPLATTPPCPPSPHPDFWVRRPGFQQLASAHRECSGPHFYFALQHFSCLPHSRLFPGPSSLTGSLWSPVGPRGGL